MYKLFHKVIMVAIILMAMMFLVACGNSDQQPTDEKATIGKSVEQVSIENSDNQLTKEDYLNDFDYMIQTMEDTFPYFGVAERRLGVDIRALGQETRATIENYPYSLQDRANELGISLEEMPELDEYIFWSIIHHEFFSHFLGFAHTFALDFGGYNLYQPTYSKSFGPTYTTNNHHAFTNPVSQSFYQNQKELFYTLAEEEADLFQFIFGIEPPVAPPPKPGSMLETEIIEEDKVAYLKVSRFSNFNYSTISTLNGFYSDLQDYEHLIIDIRDNSGGTSDFWRMFIMKALWPEGHDMPDMPVYAFYRGSELGKSLGEDNLQIEAKYSRYVPTTDHLLTVGEIMEEYNLPHINEEDVQDLAYGVRFNTSISNIEERHIQQLGFKNISYPFDGKIWLLINGNNYSAASLFARHAKEMGFATLVGEPTGGAYTTSFGAHFTMPNTGIILRWDVDYLTDGDGRALDEFPTTPHHINRPDMDALETVLELIEEGDF